LAVPIINTCLNRITTTITIKVTIKKRGG